MSAEGEALRPARGPVLAARSWPLLAGLGLGVLALGPGLRRGFLLSYDMVFVPRQPFTAALAGLAGGPPRAVPSDAVVAAASRVLPADLVQKLLLLSVFTLACSGVVALLGREAWFARLAGGVFYAWNPFVAERLIIGQWALLLGYAGLPWVLRAVTTAPVASWRGAGRLALALVPAIVGGFAAMTVTALVALPAAILARPPGGAGPPGEAGLLGDRGPAGEAGAPGGAGLLGDRGPEGEAGAARMAGAVRRAGAVREAGAPGGARRPARRRLTAGLAALGVLAVGSLPWLIPSLARPVYADPAGVAAFAARADTPFGSLGSLVMLGGMWNAQAVPAGYGGWWSVLWLALVLTALAAYLAFGMRSGRWPGLGIAALAGLLFASLGVTAGRDLLRVLGTLWPGFAVLRDGQQFTAPLALAGALGAGLLVTWAARPRASRAAAGSRAGNGSRAAGLVIAVALLLAPVLLLPGLAWGAAGRLRPVWYPASWLNAARLIDGSHAAGKVLLLPWAAYRRPAWNGGRALLDPWPRLLARQVIWNDGPLVGRVQMLPDDPAARRLGRVIAAAGPLTPALSAAGVSFVIVDAGPGTVGYAGRLPGCTVAAAAPGLAVYRVPGDRAG